MSDSFIDQPITKGMEELWLAFKETSVFAWIFGNGKENDGLSNGFGLGSSSSHSLPSVQTTGFLPSITPSLTPNAPEKVADTPSIAQMLSPKAFEEVQNIMGKSASPANENKPLIENTTPYWSQDMREEKVLGSVSPLATPNLVAYGRSQNQGVGGMAMG